MRGSQRCFWKRSKITRDSHTHWSRGHLNEFSFSSVKKERVCGISFFFLVKYSPCNASHIQLHRPSRWLGGNKSNFFLPVPPWKSINHQWVSQWTTFVFLNVFNVQKEFCLWFPQCCTAKWTLNLILFRFISSKRATFGARVDSLFVLKGPQ